MKFISDVTIPDGTQMPVGTAFTKTWRVQNSGTCNWTTSFKLVFSYGEQMGGQTVSLASTVAPGQNVDISVDLKVPNKTGKLEGIWSLVDDKGQRPTVRASYANFAWGVANEEHALYPSLGLSTPE